MKLQVLGPDRLYSHIHVLSTVGYLSVIQERGNYILQVWDFALMKYLDLRSKWLWKHISNLYLETWSELLYLFTGYPQIINIPSLLFFSFIFVLYTLGKFLRRKSSIMCWRFCRTASQCAKYFHFSSFHWAVTCHHIFPGYGLQWALCLSGPQLTGRKGPMFYGVCPQLTTFSTSTPQVLQNCLNSTSWGVVTGLIEFEVAVMYPLRNIWRLFVEGTVRFPISLQTLAWSVARWEWKVS